MACISFVGDSFLTVLRILYYLVGDPLLITITVYIILYVYICIYEVFQ